MKTWRVGRLWLGFSVMILSITATTTVSEALAQNVREVAVPGMRGIASVEFKGEDIQVSYNPRVCARLGPDLCSFFRAHEYGHIALKHLEKGTPVRQAEHEADVWAARNSTAAARAAAIKYFRSGGGSSVRHGSGATRAKRVESADTVDPVQIVSTQKNGTKTVRRYSAVAPRPFSTQSVRRVVRWWRPSR